MRSPGTDDTVAADVEMQKRPGHLIRQAHQLHGSLWASQVSKDVTPTQFSVLSAIAEVPGCDQATVSREASLDSSTAGSVIFRMVKRGWIAVQSDPLDRRRNVLSLTAEGEQLYAEISEAAAAMTDNLVAPLSGTEQSDLIRLLEALIADR